MRLMTVEVRYYKSLDYYCIYMYSEELDWSVKIEVTEEKAKNIARSYELNIHEHD